MSIESGLEAVQFLDRGFLHYPGLIPDADLAEAERIIASLYEMQARKCGYGGLSLHEALEAMEADDKEALYQVQPFVAASRVRKIVSGISGIRPLVQGWSDIELIEGPGLFINRPNTQRLLYKWHSEAHYYPKRRRFVNVWIPLFGDKTKENGAMSFKVGSHKRDFPFSEYQGYDRDTLGKPNHFVQYEIPEAFVADYPEHVCEAKRGDAILFHRRMVHRSNPNTTDRYSFALVARIYDPSDDLTISGHMAAKPYAGDIGRPGLCVRPDIT